MGAIKNKPARKFGPCTLNNPTDHWKEDVDFNQIKFALFVKQIGSTGVPHIQAVFVTKKPIRPSGLKKILGQAWHIESSYDFEAACRYISDDEKKTNVEPHTVFGFRPADASCGGASMAEACMDMVIDGATDHEIAVALPYGSFLYDRKITAFRNNYFKPLGRKRTILCHWGPTGCGKTHAATIISEDHIIIGPDDDKKLWFDGYNGQKVLIIDDFDKGCMRWRSLLRLTDKYMLRGPTKGSFVWLKPTTEYIIFTANISPEDWYNYGEEHAPPSYSPLRRRFDEIIHFGQRFNWESDDADSVLEG